jgi:ATP-binding cassette, subfamily A (ABC1), member 3
MVKKDKMPNKMIGKYLKTYLGQEVKLLQEVSSEITFQIPNALSAKFKDFFAKFDVDLDQIGIRSYGISVTTLEEVFLKVGHGELPVDKSKANLEIKAQISIDTS